MFLSHSDRLFIQLYGVLPLQYEPTWNIMEQFQHNDLHYVFGLDSLESSHPISIPVSNPDEINQIFDGISYSKGKSIQNANASNKIATIRRGRQRKYILTYFEIIK